MREIKFRAWDEKGKQIIEHENLMMTCDGFSAIDEEGTEWPMETVMQFTGLKDKNGKEIYEGDIIALHQHGGWGNRYGVFFSDGTFSMNATCDPSKKSVPVLGYNLAVIGNIYENPDLLTPTPIHKRI